MRVNVYVYVYAYESENLGACDTKDAKRSHIILFTRAVKIHGVLQCVAVFCSVLQCSFPES